MIRLSTSISDESDNDLNIGWFTNHNQSYSIKVDRCEIGIYALQIIS